MAFAGSLLDERSTKHVVLGHARVGGEGGEELLLLLGETEIDGHARMVPQWYHPDMAIKTATAA
jgi:hypothetical protein